MDVVNPNNNKMLGNTSGEFGIAHSHSEIDCDHRTRMKLEKVLKHETFLYGNACVDKIISFSLNSSVALAILYSTSVKRVSLNFSILSVPSQVASSQ